MLNANHVKTGWALSILVGLFLAAGAAIFALGDFSTQMQAAADLRSVVEAPEASFRVDVVNTPETRGRGLSGREQLGKDEGMWFVFDHPARYGFWMKDMNFPIDIIWLDDRYRVVHIEANVSPNTYPKSFTPDEESLYVLEVAAGRAEVAGITEGATLTFSQ